MYLTHSERKSVVTERFIIILRKKIYKYMIPISKNVYIAKLAYIDNEYSNTYRGVKMKHVDVKSNTY